MYVCSICVLAMYVDVRSVSRIFVLLITLLILILLTPHTLSLICCMLYVICYLLRPLHSVVTLVHPLFQPCHCICVYVSMYVDSGLDSEAGADSSGLGGACGASAPPPHPGYCTEPTIHPSIPPLISFH